MCLFTVSPLSHRLSWFVDVHEFDSLKVVIIIHAIAMMSVLSHDCSDECTWDSVPSICDVTLDQLVCPESLSNWWFRGTDHGRHTKWSSWQNHKYRDTLTYLLHSWYIRSAFALHILYYVGMLCCIDWQDYHRFCCLWACWTALLWICFAFVSQVDALWALAFIGFTSGHLLIA